MSNHVPPKFHAAVFSAVLLAACFFTLYLATLTRLVTNWAVDENYSHSFLIVPICIYLAWSRRNALASTPLRPSPWGLAVVAVSVLTMVAGTLGAELFLARVSMLGVIAGSVLFVLGWRHLRIVAFPVALLLLVIPIPSIVFNQIAFPLQLVASRVGEAGLRLAGVPVLREGNLIVLPHTTLEVAEACSGIRSLISLLSLAIIYGYFSDPRSSVRAVLAVISIPVAILVNGLRVAGTGLLAQGFGQRAAEGFFHAFSGWLMFLAAFAILVAVHRVLAALIPQRAAAKPERLPVPSSSTPIERKA